MNNRNLSPVNAQPIFAENVDKFYGQMQVLRSITLEIPAGQRLAIMGPSASGKSTLLHCLSGILLPEGGRIFLGKQEVSNLSDRQRSLLRMKQIGFVFQDGQLLPELSLEENVALPALLAGENRESAYRAANELLGQLGLGGLGTRRLGTLSGGQAQRVALARALICRPAVIFADEPTGALDQATGQEVMQVLTSMARLHGTTLVVVTHDSAVAAWCDRVIEIRDGMIHADSNRPQARPTAEAHEAFAGQTLPVGQSPTTGQPNFTGQTPLSGQYPPAGQAPWAQTPMPGAHPAGNFPLEAPRA
ncbi:hypothetical protein BK816_00800 [Boudabousia tangfeifanii]|uniref:ABC transporter domain-containing protein n=1 Tax=Boudabousia tangfeifanii TaxID=1912795 RepID=A0A1D9MII1_9ACTO|nr:hypothetical protein BK816_00800 [Boudabousia tangfeifanii]